MSFYCAKMRFMFQRSDNGSLSAATVKPWECRVVSKQTEVVDAVLCRGEHFIGH